MNLAANWDLGWETMVAIIVAVIVCGFLLMVLLLRNPASKKLRVGMFVERQNNGKNEADEDTHEWPTRKG